jgi:hypothetical protein
MRYPAIDVDVTWLFARPTAEGLQVTFRIDRTKDECRTPRRCPEVEAVLRFGQELNGWCESVRRTVFNRRVQIAQAYSHRNAEGDAERSANVAPRVEDDKLGIGDCVLGWLVDVSAHHSA